MTNYFFSGIKHCGKSTHAKIFAKKRDLPFYDLDCLIQSKIEPLSVREYYKQFGKEKFMSVEFQALKDFLEIDKSDKVIALGGGICDYDKTLDLCKKMGILIFIKVDEKTLYQRIIEDGVPPFLEGNPKKKFKELFERREKIYLNNSQIVIKIEDQTIEKTAQVIEAEINNWERNGTQ